MKLLLAIVFITCAGLISRGASLEEQVVEAINTSNSTNLLSLLTPTARPSDDQAKRFIEEVQTLFGALTYTTNSESTGWIHYVAILGKPYAGTTIRISHEVKSTKSTDAGVILVYAAGSNSLWQAVAQLPPLDTNTLWQIKIDGLAAPADINRWTQIQMQQAVTKTTIKIVPLNTP